ncbi:MAG: TonB family protein [Pseudomonadota bacterium]
MATHIIPSINPEDRLSLTLVLAAAVHAIVILGVSFSPDAKSPPIPRSLEVVLLQTKTQQAPDLAEFLAQANQQASGSTDSKDRPSSPFLGVRPQPSPGIAPLAMEKTSAGGVEAKKHLLLSQRDRPEKVYKNEQPAPRNDPNTPQRNTHIQRSLEIAQLAAELAESERRYARQPRISYIDTLSAKTAIEAGYIKAWVDRVERVGNLNYPDQARRRKLNGSLILHVLLNNNGSIERTQISSGSGQQVLDDAARRIVNQAAPFAPFPNEMRDSYDQLMITRTWVFQNENSFTTH